MAITRQATDRIHGLRTPHNHVLAPDGRQQDRAASRPGCRQGDPSALVPPPQLLRRRLEPPAPTGQMEKATELARERRQLDKGAGLAGIKKSLDIILQPEKEAALKGMLKGT